MRQDFPLFNTPIDLLHSFFPKLLQKGDIAIDATAGGGHDSLALAKELSKHKDTSLIAIDIQKKAIEKTLNRLAKEAPDYLPYTQLIEGSHENLPKVSPKLILYNLGYFPGGDKAITTMTDSTLKSLQSAMDILQDGGVISITCYPGHAEGEKELTALSLLLNSLSPKEWSCTLTQWKNRRAAPALILMQKATSPL